MTIWTSRREEMKRILIEIECLRHELRDDPEEFEREMAFLQGWCEGQTKLAFKEAEKVAAE